MNRSDLLQRRIQLRAPSPRLAWIFLGLISVATTCLCFFYLLHSWQYLADWYLSLNSDIPHKAIWQTKFFNAQTKTSGNIFCWISIALSAPLAFLSIKETRKSRPKYHCSIRYIDLLLLFLFGIFASGLWCWGQGMAEVGADEMYSAYYCAGIHPFQTLSYYMDPNNHILFNLINRILFFGVDDKVLTGRVISLLSYITLIAILYLWIKGLTKSTIATFLITLAISTQFQILGFAQLARGYELYLLIHWVAFITFYSYLNTKNATYLIWFALTNAAGFLTIPTYLYFFVSIGIVGALYQIYKRQIDLPLCKYLILSGLLAFLAYVPAILFSGLHAITANDFVAARSPVSFSYFLTKLEGVIQEILWIDYPTKTLLYGLILLIPIPFIFNKTAKQERLIFLSYFLIWPVYFAIAIYMKHFASMRNIIWQEQFTLLTVLLAIYHGMKWLAMRMKKPVVSWFVFPLFVLLITHFLIFFPWQIDFALYGISTHKHNDEVSQTIKSFPHDARVACPDFAISWLYLAKNAGYSAVAYPTGKEEIYVTHDADNAPGTIIPGYKFWKTQSYYFIYVRKDLNFPP